MRMMFVARLKPASRFLPSSVSRNFPSASTRRTIEEKIVLAFEREHGIDEIVARALLAELDLEAVGEEGEEPRLNRRSNPQVHPDRPVSFVNDTSTIWR